MKPSEAKISATLPKEDGPNGLHSIAPDLVDDPERMRYAIVVLDTGSLERKFEIDSYGERYEVIIPKARIRAIEPVPDIDRDTAARLMATARERRLHGTRLPLFGASGVVTEADVDPSRLGDGGQ